MISTSSTFLQILQPQGSPERLTFYNRHSCESRLDFGWPIDPVYSNRATR